jgi:hypothetical protein
VGSIGLALMARSQILQSFVARIWLEQAGDKDPTWRGHIQHIQGQEEAYFQDLGEMSEFMEQVSGISDTDFIDFPDKVVELKKHDPGDNKKPNPIKRDD